MVFFACFSLLASITSIFNACYSSALDNPVIHGCLKLKVNVIYIKQILILGPCKDGTIHGSSMDGHIYIHTFSQSMRG